MLQELIESRARPVRRRGGSVVSVAVHAAAVGLAVAATGRAAPRAAEPAPPDLVFVAPSPLRAAPARPSRPAGAGAATPGATPTPTPDLSLRLPAVDLPATLPAADPPAAVRELVGAGEFAHAGLTAGGAGPGLGAGGAGAGDPGPGPLGAAAVDEPVVADPGNRPPRYPEALRAAGVEGRVVAQFVVDTLGRVEGGTVRVVAAGHPLLAGAVREALGRMRFRPARAGGRRVRRLVELPFAFALGPGGAGGAGAPR